MVNREVVIHPTDQGDSGERPDIKIDALDPKNDTITVPIEIKGSWHDDLLTAQDDQLAQRYLLQMDTTDGIYLVGWYPVEHWNTSPQDDGRKAKANRHGPLEQLKTRLREQADEILKQRNTRTHPYVLPIPRAVPASK